MKSLLRRGYEEAKELLRATVDPSIFNDSIKIYQDKNGEKYLATIDEVGASEYNGNTTNYYYLGIKEVLEGGIQPILKDIGVIAFSKSGGQAFIDEVRVDAELNNVGIGGLAMSHAMQYITDVLKRNNISLSACGECVREIVNCATYKDEKEHLKYLVEFYKKYGFREMGNGDETSVTMYYDDEIGFRKAKEINREGMDICIPEYTQKGE